GGGAGGPGGRTADREPGGMLPRRRRLSRLPCPPRPRAQGRVGRRREGGRARSARGLLAVHSGAAARPRRRRGTAALRDRCRPGEESRTGRAARVACTTRGRRLGLPSCPDRSGNGQASLPLAGDRRLGGGDPGRVTAPEREVLPVINKVGGTVDRVNAQLDKVDEMTDSAVDAVESVDTAIRSVSVAVTRPVQIASGFAAGVTHGVASLKTTRDWRR